jgi:hypothetical protein
LLPLLLLHQLLRLQLHPIHQFEGLDRSILFRQLFSELWKELLNETCAAPAASIDLY